MRFLADESCDATIARSLQNAGHDVMALADIMPTAEDARVIDLAVRDGRMLLTEDKDFGQLVYASGASHCGVFLRRYPVSARAAIAQALVELVAQRDEQLACCFIVVQPGRIRISGAGEVP
jgi:predicted nuclease of predicted toxin-antitoxin system